MNAISRTVCGTLCLLISGAAVCLSPAAETSTATGKYDALLPDPVERQKLTTLTIMEESRRITPGIIEALAADGNELVRLRCAEVLGRTADPGYLPLLVTLTGDDSDEVVETAVFGIGLIGGEESLEPLGACLKSKPRRIKLRALEALGRTKIAGAAPLITARLTDFHASMRGAAALALAMLGDSSSAAGCINPLDDPDPYVISCALYALGRLGCEKAAKEITRQLIHDDPSVRLRAVEALGRLKSDDAVKPIARLLHDNDRMVAIKAAESLARIGGGGSAEALSTLLTSKDSYLVTAALRGIAASKNKKLYDDVLPLLDANSYMVRIAAIETAAATGGDKARESLLSIIENGRPLEQKTALEQLGTLSMSEDLETLVMFLRTSSNPLLREGAAAGLGSWRRHEELATPGPAWDGEMSPFDALIEAASGGDWVIASIAVESIGKTGSPGMIDDLASIFSSHGGRVDSDRKLAIIAAVESIAERDALGSDDLAKTTSFLRTAATDNDPRVCDAAVKAAESLGATLKPQPGGPWLRGSYPWGEPSLPLGDRRIVIRTSRGEIEIVLFGDDAPNIVKSILTLAEAGFYDGLTFHRVVPGFVIQGGCPRGDGWGDAGYYLRSQFNLHHYERGTVGVAHAGTDTPGSQFFITHTPQPHLDGRYTVVGKVVSGMDVADRIEVGDTFTVIPVE